MSKKPKTTKRLDKLFKDITPEVNDSGKKTKPPLKKEAAPPPATVKPDSKPQQSPITQKIFHKPQTSKLVLPEVYQPSPISNGKSTYATNFQIGEADWATMRLVDENQERAWTADEQLLIKQVTDQLSLALENARLFQETQRRAQELAVVNEVVSSVSSSYDLKTTLQSITDSLVNLFSAQNVGIALMNPEKTALILTAESFSTFQSSNDIGLEIPIQGNPSTEEVIRTRKPLFIKDIETDLLAKPIQELLKSQGTKNLLILPLITEEEILGTIGLAFYDSDRVITQEELGILETIVSQVATAIQKNGLFQRVEQSETNLRALFSAMEDVVLVITREGRYDQIAPTSPSLLIRTPNEMLGKTFHELLPKEIADSFLSKTLEAIDGGVKVQFEYDLTIQGQLIWFLATLTKLDDTRAFWVARDITERKKSEEELRKSQEQYALATQAANDGLWDWDIITDEIYYSPRWKSMLGFEDHELTQGFSDWERLIHPDDHDYALASLDKYLAGTADAYDIEIRLRHKDGSWRWIRDRGKALRDAEGKPFRMAGSHSDVTDRRIATESLRRRNEYLAASSEIGKIITSTLDLNSIFTRTVDLIIERFNFYHASIFIVEETGFNAVIRESTGKAGAEMKRNNHSLELNDKSIVGKVSSDGFPIIVNNVKENPLHKFNPLLPETAAEAAIPLKIGQRVIGVIDIQAKAINAFEDDEISVLQTLADQVAVAIDNARSFELSQQAVMEMREIDRLKSQFLANMSHELRTPLNSIIGFSRVILKGIDGPVTDLMQQDLSAIYNSGQHLLGLINDILDLAKIEAGKMELAFDEVNIGDLTNSVLSTMSGLIKDKPVQMRRVVAPDVPLVKADAIRIRQVMINLLSNAAKFTDDGEIVVDISLLKNNGRSEVQISVIDSGAGISEEDQQKLFQPFSQVDASPTRKTGGTGLGLSICKQLINMHGGEIWVESQEGKGSKFHFTLPVFPKDNGINSDGEKIILAIDDDTQVISLYERYLNPQGYQIIPLTDAKQAVEKVKQVKPFAITLDIMMPGIEGWTVLDQLKSDPDTRHYPVIICSIVEELEKGFSLGASDYLVKPILEEDIVHSLNRLNIDGSIREVLVIDDNPNDLRLLGKILSDDGRYKPILADSGRNGWNIINSGNPPHAIVLDLFMPDVDGFQLLEKLQTDKKLRDIPTIVISGMEITAEQKNQLREMGQRLLTKGSFTEQELLSYLQKSLEKIGVQK